MSAIDPTKPTYGDATTSSVRDNFAIAASEIDELETSKATRDELAQHLPLNGSRAMTGLLTLTATTPTGNNHATRKAYVDATAATARDDALETAAGLYLPLAGGNVTGQITLLNPGTQPSHAATRQFVETRVAKDGDVMTGPLTLFGAPTADLHAATRAFVVGQVADRVQRSGDTMTGPLTLPGDPTTDQQAAPAGWVNRQIGSVAGITEAPDDSRIHGRSPGRWDPVVPLFGGQMTGPLYLHADPLIANGAATARFVLRAAVPIGTMVDFAGKQAPSRWLMCAGQEVSREIYAELFEVIGTDWGQGDGETTFNVPDFRGRNSVGLDFDPNWKEEGEDGAEPPPPVYANRVTAGVSGINAAVVGAAGGNEHLHSHGHGYDDPTHNHDVGDGWHNHGFPDPGHAHIQVDHQHHLWDPGHVHQMGDPGHEHAVNPILYHAPGHNVQGSSGITINDQVRMTDLRATGVFTHGAGTNALADWGGRTWTEGGGTNRTIEASPANIVVYHRGVGIVIHAAGGGLSQNMPPCAVCPKIIYAGVTPEGGL